MSRTHPPRLAKTPGFALTAIVTLGLGVGANAAIFTVVNAVLIQALPYPDADRLIYLGHTAPGLDVDEMFTSYGTYAHYREHSETIEESGLLINSMVNLAGDGEPVRLSAAAVTSSLLPVLGVRPLLGRGFTAADDNPDTPSVVLLSHGLWQQRFGGFYRLAYARMRPGVTARQVTAEINALMPSLADAYDVPAQLIEEARIGAIVRPLRDQILGDVGRSLWLVLGAVGGVLLIACANVANLFLVRPEGRHREVAVRQALGASGGQLVRYFLSEAALLSAAGMGLGLGIAWFAVRAVVASGVDVPRLHEVGIDATVVWFTVSIALATGLLFGGFPILRYARIELSAALKDDSRSATAGRARHRGRSVLVVAQVALALTLLVGSALLAQSFWRLSHVDPGFEAGAVLTAQIVLPGGEYPGKRETAAFYYRAVEKLQALPGAESAAMVSDLPLSGGIRMDPLYVEGSDQDPSTLPSVARFKYVTPGYFEVMGIELEEGRLFRQSDEGTAPIVITRQLADEFWPGESALGKRAHQDSEGELGWATVVGVVSSVHDETLEGDPSAVFYYPVLEGDNGDLQMVPGVVNIVIRASGDPLALAGALPQAIWQIDPDLPIANIRPMAAIMRQMTARSRFTMTLLLLAAGVAVFLGAVGLYGVIAYAVSQRSREIGVRMALGASGRDVRRMILRQGTRVAGLGLIAGMVAALALNNLLDSLLFEIGASDPPTYIAASALLLLVAVVATYLPARRAAAVEPAVGLRTE